jgi:hypothetical protein
MNTHNKYFFDEKPLIEALKKFLDQIIPKFFKNNTSVNIVDEKHEINNQNEDNNYGQNVENLLNTMNDIANILSEDPLFKEDEFYDFMHIQRITEHILKTKKRENMGLVYDLITNFIDIYELKTNSIEEYDNSYKQFKIFLLESREKFYTQIYTPTNKHKQTINKLYRIMEQDFIEEVKN